eukprot:GHUV01008413.1.p1 GENE.GHUV01008413.1~~GHUV01008413.1.p1  ORF type:complete len:239 (+),score=26.50 GHUV01008413.1:190-906(+)
MDWIAVAGGLIIAYLLYSIYKAWQESRAPPPPPAKWMVGDLTAESLAFHNGYDWSKPTCLAVEGVIYDVSKSGDLYGPGKQYAVYAGRECARALAKDSLAVADCTADLSDCTEEELQRLRQKQAHFRDVYDEVGKVVPVKQFTLDELSRHDGSDPSLPMLLSIRGVVFDITTGKNFYGPDGIYPFAGHEVARAFALISTDVKDCNDNLEGLGAMEMDSLKEWEMKFNSKYPIVGQLVK